MILPADEQRAAMAAERARYDLVVGGQPYRVRLAWVSRRHALRDCAQAELTEILAELIAEHEHGRGEP